MQDWTDWSARRAEARGALFFFAWPVREEGADKLPDGIAAWSWALPMAGLAVGVVGALVYAILAGLNAPSVAAGLAVAASSLINGGLNERGLARIADSAAGETAGIAAVVLSVSLRAAAVAAAGTGLGVSGVTGALVGSCVLSRGLLPVALALDEDGAAGKPSGVNLAIALVFTSALAFLALGLKGAIICALVAAAAMAAAFTLARSRGDMADTLGATAQAGETAALLAAAALA
jgi:adenosylcobinamide-GDP ribazoletransferase